jgi:L-threonylcarbamoyladenylate synthase
MSKVRTVGADAAGARLAVDVLSSGGVAVLPTDTVYGLAARPADPGAVRAVFSAKGRPEGMHLPVLAASVAQVRALGVAFTPDADALARAWWPGPLTLAFGFEHDAERPPWLAGRDEVAVRIPAHGFLRAVLRETGVLLVTSANRHGAPTPLTALDVSDSLGADVAVVVDGGTLSDVPSTLVNVRTKKAVVEREGAISRADVAATVAGAA